MLPAEIDWPRVVENAVILVSGGGLTAVGAWILNILRERREARTADTTDSIKRDRAKLNIKQAADAAAWENQQLVFNDLYEKYLKLHERVDDLQEKLIKSEIDRAVATTQLHECQRSQEEIRGELKLLKRGG